MAGGWFESVAEAQRRAKRSLPASVYMAIWAGTEHGLTLTDNVEAFGELGFAPHVADLPGERDLTTTVMGQTIALPVIISPTGVQAVNPDGEVAVARAAASRGTAMGLSSFASKPVEEVVAANGQTFFQVYWAGSREEILSRVQRAKAAGAVGLIVTLDWTFSHGRDWGSPAIPGAARLPHDVAIRAGGGDAPALVLRMGQGGTTAGSDGPQHGRRRRRSADVLRRLRPMDADQESQLGRPAVAARAMGRPVHAQGRDARRRRQAGGRRRRERHLRVQPRRQQPRRDAGDDSRAPGDRRRRRRSDRGPPRRRRPARQRCRQSAGARRPCGDDRPGIPVGPCRQRTGRAWRTCSTSCAAASTRHCSASAAHRCASSLRPTC